jgi:hypothetical protein
LWRSNNAQIKQSASPTRICIFFSLHPSLRARGTQWKHDSARSSIELAPIYMHGWSIQTNYWLLVSSIVSFFVSVRRFLLSKGIFNQLTGQSAFKERKSILEYTLLAPYNVVRRNAKGNKNIFLYQIGQKTSGGRNRRFNAEKGKNTQSGGGTTRNKARGSLFY